MMYLSTTLGTGPHLRTVMAHEYTHAVTFSAKVAAAARLGRPAVEEEGWLEEGLAHLAEDLHAFSRSNLDYRVSAFLSRPERYRLVVDDYYTADLFRSHGNRGGTYLFLRWCADVYGPGLLPALIRSERRGVANLEAATGLAFEELYRRWSIALFLGGLESGRDRAPVGRVSFDQSPRDVRRLGSGRPADHSRAPGRPGRYLVGGRHEQPLRGGRGVVHRRGGHRGRRPVRGGTPGHGHPLAGRPGTARPDGPGERRARRRPPPPRPDPTSGAGPRSTSRR